MAHSKLYVKLMNSREWRELRIRKLQANPLCERCQAEHGWVVPARCVHHIIPIEASTSEAEARERAFNFNNLQSLCYECHREIHQAEGYHSSDVVRERNQQRQSAWEDAMMRRFGRSDELKGES